MNILITRPKIQAQHTVSLIKKTGGCVFIVPLTKISPLDFTLPRQCFEALLATSANAFLSSQELIPLQSLPLFCVGEKTALAAQKAGFTAITTITAQAYELVAHLQSHPARHFLYLAGKTRRPILEQGLTAQGKTISILETYQQCPLYPSPHVIATLPAHFDYVLFYCAMAARAILSLETLFSDDTRFLCLSPRIAHALPQKFQQQAYIAHSPTEASLLEFIKANHQ